MAMQTLSAKTSPWLISAVYLIVCHKQINSFLNLLVPRMYLWVIDSVVHPTTPHHTTMHFTTTSPVSSYRGNKPKELKASL